MFCIYVLLMIKPAVIRAVHDTCVRIKTCLLDSIIVIAESLSCVRKLIGRHRVGW